ncbi:hypothetical protein MMC10_004070 [Thelotrema lepadinum]|nr:hypothetical protein [Thelotrema lepadinum]
MHSSFLPTALVATASLFTTTNAHSWVDLLRLVTDDSTNATYTGVPGASRGYYNHSLPGFNDTKMVYFVEESKETNPSMCADTQQLGAPQPDGAVSLQAAPGAKIALLYQENGHVTLPQNVPGKQNNSGTVYIYGTAQPKQNETFYDIHKIWNTAGTGGDKRGKLLTTQNFDDGQCYQKNTSPIYADRSAKFPIKTATDPEGEDLWCQNNIVLPQEAQAGKPYSLYWVWDWPTLPGTPDQPKGMNQTYTTCIDIDVVAASSTNSKAAASAKDAAGPAPGIQQAALPSVIQKIGDGNNVYVQTSAIQGGVPAASSAAASSAPQSQPTASAAAATTPKASSAAPTAATSGAALSVVPVPTGNVPTTTAAASSAAATSPAVAASSAAAPAVSVSIETVTVFTDHSAAAATGVPASAPSAAPTGVLSEVSPSGSGGPMVPAATSPAQAVVSQASSATGSAPACKPSGAQKRSLIFGEQKRSVVFGGEEPAAPVTKRSTEFVEEPLEEALAARASAPRSKRRSPKFAKNYMRS